MRYLAIIQARCNSTRLKNKVVLPLGETTVLDVLIERVKKSRFIDEIVVATTKSIEDNIIEEICNARGIVCFRGDENDVLDRYYQVALMYNPHYVIRITADCPFYDVNILDDAILSMKKDCDYLGMLSNTFADGLDVEIFKFSALKCAWEKATMQSQREHVTQYIINNPDVFSLQDYRSEIQAFGKMRWTLDTEEDYKFICKVYDKLAKDNIYFNYIDVFKILEDNPEICKINQMYSRNEGLRISIENDYEVTK